MIIPPDIAQKARAILRAKEADFLELAQIAQLDPARDFVGSDLSDVEFGNDDLSAFDFRRANIIGADLSRTRKLSFSRLDGAKFNQTTQFPQGLGRIEQLTRFWKDGVPSFVSAFGFDEYGQWFEFEIAGANGAVTQRMRWIAPGKFLMGSPEGEASALGPEVPQHEVTFEQGFWLFDTVVAQGLWLAVMGDNNPSVFKNADHPVENVSWDDAREFITKINARVPGLNLSLPSEAQWEYACRADTKTPFSFGESITPDQVNYGQTFRDAAELRHRRGAVAVASLPANGWGLYEMHGNVWEWCADAWYGSYEVTPTDGSA
jgi:formylglycine-generating enzyme required for sulfatase activity